MYEDMETDNGVAFNTENFDEDFSYRMSIFDDFSCDGCWEDCCWSEDEVHKYCQAWKQCREDYETL